MKLTKQQLKRLIKEELAIVLEDEESIGAGIADAAAKNQEGISDRTIMEEDDEGFVAAADKIEKKGTEGVFTAKAKKRGMSAQEFARKVLANTDEYDTKTVRQASFAKGAQTVANRRK